jgi:hypothetical protein
MWLTVFKDLEEQSFKPLLCGISWESIVELRLDRIGSHFSGFLPVSGFGGEEAASAVDYQAVVPDTASLMEAIGIADPFFT